MDPLDPVWINVVVADALYQLTERDARLEAGQRCAETEVAPDAKADRCARIAPEVVAIRLREDPGIAVCRSGEQQHPTAGRHDTTVQRDIDRRGAGEHLTHCVVAKGLFDPIVDTGSTGERRHPLIREPPGPAPGVPEELGRRLIAGDDH